MECLNELVSRVGRRISGRGRASFRHVAEVQEEDWSYPGSGSGLGAHVLALIAVPVLSPPLPHKFAHSYSLPTASSRTPPTLAVSPTVTSPIRPPSPAPPPRARTRPPHRLPKPPR